MRLSLWWLPLVLVLIGLVGMERSVADVVRAAAEQRARAMAVDAINRAVMARVASGLQQRELIHYRYDQQGRVTLLAVDTPVINQVASDAAMAAQDAMEHMASTHFAIPLGQALGSKLLGNVGPNLPLEFSPLGTAQVLVGQRFDSAGINQTRHIVYLKVVAQLQVVVPLITSRVEVQSELPLTEAVIVGPVPQTYGPGGAGIITSAPGSGTKIGD